MTKLEQRFFDFIKKHLLLISFFLVTMIGLLIRFCGLKYISYDYLFYLEPWWNEITSGGFYNISKQVGNYNIPYQICIYLLSLLPMDELYAYKFLSIVFDFVLSISVAEVVNELNGKKNVFLPIISYAFTFCSLTVILNSAFWAQCDSIYVTFIVLAFYFTIKEKNIAAFIMLGLSFSFKLQLIFILPFFLIYYVLDRKISILHFFITTHNLAISKI